MTRMSDNLGWVLVWLVDRLDVDDSGLRLHPAAYLMKRRGDQRFRRTPFNYSLTSPCSAAISHALHDDLVFGLIEERDGHPGYRLTELGRSVLRELPNWGDVPAVLRDASLPCLQLAAKALFLSEERGRSDWNSALKEAAATSEEQECRDHAAAVIETLREWTPDQVEAEVPAIAG